MRPSSPLLPLFALALIMIIVIQNFGSRELNGIERMVDDTFRHQHQA